MKILRISLCNIASLAGTHTVDFTHEPLRSAGLFAISGPTGSGKSTLLDALCLALYERTPRLNGIRGTVKFEERGGEITQQDPGNLLRRGTARGFAEVAFIGVDGAIYTARWSVRRARNLPGGALQPTELVLFRGDVQPEQQGAVEQSGKKSEVLPVIESRVGLSFRQFTRAVLLAQNDFATFLKADDRDRAEILQALTGTERFEALSVAVFERHSEAQRAVEEIRVRMEGSVPLPADSRSAAEGNCAAAEAAVKATADGLATRLLHAQWFANLASLQAAATGAEVALNAAVVSRDGAIPRKAALEQTETISREGRPLRDAAERARAEFAAAEKSRDLAEKAEAAARTALEQKCATLAAFEKASVAAVAAMEQARPLFLQARAIDARLPDAERLLAGAAAEQKNATALMGEADARRDAVRVELRTLSDEQTALETQRDSLAAYLPFAGDAAAWNDRFTRAADTRSALDAVQRDAKTQAKADAKKRTEADAARKASATLCEATGTAKTALEQAGSAAREFDGAKNAASRKAASDAVEALRQQREAARLFAIAAKHELESKADGAKLAQLRSTALPEAEARFSSAQHSLELAQAAVAEATVALRAKLEPGYECPVCGSKEHPFTAHAPVGEVAALRALRDDCEVKRKALATLNTEVAKLEALALERDKASAELAPLLEKARANSPAVEVLDEPELERRLANAQAELRAAETRELARVNAEAQREKCRAAFDQAAAASSLAERKLADVESALAVLNSTLATTELAAAKADAANTAALSVLTPLFQAIPGVDAATFAAQTTAATALAKKTSESSAQAERAKAALIPAEEAAARTAKDTQAKTELEQSARATLAAIQVERARFFEGKAADAVEAALTLCAKEAAEIRDRVARETHAAETARATCAETLRTATASVDERSKLHSAATTLLATWMTGRALNRPALDLALSRDEAWFRAERAALDALQHAVQSTEGALKVYRDSLNAHVAARPTQDDESTTAAHVATSREELMAAEKKRDGLRAMLLADDRCRAAGMALAGELEVRQNTARPWERLNDLIGSADGAKFRSIAQRRTLDILLGYANAQLAHLAARYRLERIRESLNLIVIDCDMGDERRSVHSLSGGESFLVSLALALGLAALTSNRLRIESLFIDEGFGNLDGDTLNVAMSALMRLESQGRKVGVISHVAEMTDAIPVQIRVAKARNGAARLIVPGAAAPEPEAPDPIVEVAARMLAIVQREQRISTRALREELGCDARVFQAARDTLGDAITVEGRSLTLAQATA